MLDCLFVLLFPMLSPMESGVVLNQTVYNLNWPSKPYPDYCKDDDYDDCFLNLYNDGSFTIEISCDLSDDMLSGYELSTGQYEWKRDTLLLHDTRNQLELKMIRKRRVIRIINGFPFMRGYDFVYSHKTRDKKYVQTENHMITNQMDYSVSDERPLNDLQCRPYVWHYDLDYSIIISEDNTYKIMDSNLLLSEGRWERKENLLIMHDNSFICKYYAVIGENELFFIPIGFSTIKTFK